MNRLQFQSEHVTLDNLVIQNESPKVKNVQKKLSNANKAKIWVMRKKLAIKTKKYIALQ